MALTVLSADAAAAVTMRLASTTLVVRDAPLGLEVLMVRRSLQASFMPGAYVFPGGAVDPADGESAAAALADETAKRIEARVGAVTGVGPLALTYAVAGLRECFEECGLWLGSERSPPPALRARLHRGESIAALACEAGLPLATSALQPWSRWVTPFGIPKRFDTLFFVARAPGGQVPEVDAGETTALAWVHPPAALQAHAEGAFPMEFATLRTVESLQPYADGSAASLLAAAASRTTLEAIHPRLLLDSEGRLTGVLLPDEAGYADAFRAAGS